MNLHLVDGSSFFGGFMRFHVNLRVRQEIAGLMKELWLGFHTLPKFNSSPLKSYLPTGKVVFQPPFFRGKLLNFGGVILL